MDHFRKAIPILASLNIEETIDFYHNRLHFTLIYQTDKYVVLEKDQLTLHFQQTEDAELPGKVGCYVEVTAIDHLYKEMKMAGVVHPDEPLEDKDWDMREFAIRDADGNTIRFGEQLPIVPRA